MSAVHSESPRSSVVRAQPTAARVSQLPAYFGAGMAEARRTIADCWRPRHAPAWPRSPSRAPLRAPPALVRERREGHSWRPSAPPPPAVQSARTAHTALLGPVPSRPARMQTPAARTPRRIRHVARSALRAAAAASGQCRPTPTANADAGACSGSGERACASLASHALHRRSACKPTRDWSEAPAVRSWRAGGAECSQARSASANGIVRAHSGRRRR